MSNVMPNSLSAPDLLSKYVDKPIKHVDEPNNRYSKANLASGAPFIRKRKNRSTCNLLEKLKEERRVVKQIDADIV